MFDPFVIMFSVPFAFSGVFLGLLITQVPLDTMSFIGLIMLIGIVVKNGIVLIDYIRLCRERGMGVAKAVTTSGKSPSASCAHDDGYDRPRDGAYGPRYR